MQRALGKGTRDYQIFDPANSSQTVIGRIVGKGLHDELAERGYVIVDALDGRAHYAALAADVDMTTLPMGAIVEFRPTETRTADRQVLAATVRGIYRPGDHLAHLRTLEPQAQEPAAVIQGYVRRLEALRRRGIVERISEDVWRIPADLPEKGRAFDLKRLDGVSVDLRCHLPVERQAQVIGATWLDQQLVRGSKDLPTTEFGTIVRNALQKREDFLINEGLARRAGPQVVLAQNLLATLRNREISDAGARLEATTGLFYRPTIGDGRVSGTYRESAQLVSGRFAILEDGLGFSLVPWRPVIEKRLGQHLSAITQGLRVSWDLGRSRKLSL
jgi:hypothetical protein